MTTKKSRDERIAEILDAGKKVFLKKGFKNAYMEDIIAETSLSKGGFYYYYKDKKDIFFEILSIASDKSMSKLINKKENLNSKTKFKNFFKNMLYEIIFDESDEAKMYMIFISEISGNPEFLKYLNKLEEKYFGILKDLFSDVFIELTEKEIKDKVKILYYTFHAISYYAKTLKIENLYKDNMDVLEKIYEDIF